MKTWTIVLEIKDDGFNTHNPIAYLKQEEIENLFLNNDIPAGISCRIMEVTPHPYGPQEPPSK